MEKLILTVVVLGILVFSCKKEVENDNNNNNDCECGVIEEIEKAYINDVWSYEVVIYNQCSANDTTIYHMPETNSGKEKGMNDPHCLGVSW